jgi:hypothetical protein
VISAATYSNNLAAWEALLLIPAIIGFISWAVWAFAHFGEFWHGTFRDRATVQKVIRALNALGPRWLKSFKSSMLVGIPGAPAALITLGSVYVNDTILGARGINLDWLISIFVAVFLTVGFLTFSIMLFNRPRFLVPPYLRDYRGFFGDWLREVTEKRQRKE